MNRETERTYQAANAIIDSREENGRFSGGSDDVPQPARGDYHEGLEEGWKAGEAQERRIWEEAVKLSLGTIPEGLRNALKQVRAGIEGDT